MCIESPKAAFLEMPFIDFGFELITLLRCLIAFWWKCNIATYAEPLLVDRN